MNFPLFGLGNESKSVNVSAQERLNCYFEQRPDGDKNVTVAFGTATLDAFTAAAGQPWRALHVTSAGRMFGVQQNMVYEVMTDGTLSLLGNVITSTGRASMADNGAQVMICDGFGYIITLATSAFTQILSAQYPANTPDVTFQDGYFIVPSNSGQFFLSAPYDGLTWNATDFATAESNPDSLQRVVASNGELILFGTRTTEFWANHGGVQFPYTNLRGSTNAWAIASPRSLADYDTSLIALWRSGQSGLIAGVLNRYQVQRVSTPDIESQWLAFDWRNASGFSYMAGGHQFYQINFPTKSYLYDGTSGLWSTLEGYGLPRHRAEHGRDWGVNGYVVADHQNGSLYKMNATGTNDAGQPVVRRIRGRHLFNDSKLISVSELIIDMERGYEGTVENPQVMLRVSKDGGHTWVMERWTSIGKIGEYSTPRAKFRRLGEARDWVLEVSVSDPVRFAVINAYMEAQ